MPGATPADVVVSVCDSNGRLIWSTMAEPCCGVNNPIWQGAMPKYAETVRAAVSRVVSLKEPQRFEAANLRGEYYKVRMWPVDSPEIAVCLLAFPVPNEIAQLSARERHCLQLLGTGTTPNDIAAALNISVSTTHTHLKRAREKLGIQNIETLISFAARHCLTVGMVIGMA